MKNLGFTLDCHLTMNAHVSNIARTCYFELRRLASIRRFLTSTATATLVSAFILSRIDYCNSLLFGSTNDVTSHLQRIQNYAARVIFRLPMSSSITIHLKSPHPIFANLPLAEFFLLKSCVNVSRAKKNIFLLTFPAKKFYLDFCIFFKSTKLY